MFITIVLPGIDISSMSSTKIALEKQLTYGWETGFNYYDPFLQGKDKPIKVTLTKDPMSGAAIDKTDAFVFPAGTHFPNGLTHDNILGDDVQKASVEVGKIDQANEEQGGVFLVRATADDVPYIEYATTTKGWTVDATLKAADEQFLAGSGKTMFVREGCWWCHTLLPEQTQDWQSFGRPPLVGDFNGESPTTFGSDRKAPDLLHVGSRNSSREWMVMHFFNPRLVQPHSIMPRYDYLWGSVDANGQPIDLAAWDEAYLAYDNGESINAPVVPLPAADSEARMLIDFIINLK
ncbi:MAG: cytochrome oxidase [Zetaproteobacteria bacterium CG06_land_8_20_14_3_00_59_53]|nr:MAG: cytochrome oxidase [Zetaproteobacteria bacterium CG23_combo_of_CG06-09_8_20_14_all_59_86]PIQ64390.1 MAG: cytochrome oxidase [Zetaproteobacteria bacterium CG11_big_fil_rev_8_21_14_0_20_59_439]PIU69977.1 MAG: cytochrome oxidase [Zetaproteobacteria bacterium CG06_land_8_20_14_3_00_59_53]PIU96012.1 MAG: cytochrome oxidase [Zetaproteobacteria bacterium CG03_land_8_20_14_0_80_59_51]PIY45789.1 MAG: cytochrome oxidase [Zetaproteobacteria bacterium CG_4_10_14_0_8_um_filter_59_127]PJC18523.1 MAG